jgi:uncharacterized protein (TIGR00255 family)
MIRSMTGFASVAREDGGAQVAVTIRAVNHRYLDLQLRVPSSCAAIESDLRTAVGRHVSRGRIELSLTVQLRRPPSVAVDLNEEMVQALEAAFDRARARGLVAGALTPGDLLRLPQALSIKERPLDTASDAPETMRLALAAVDQALADLNTMRRREGDHLRADLDERRLGAAGLVERIAAAADQGRAAMEARLTERVQQIRADLQADEAAVAQEIVRTAARSDISEEVARFRGHVVHWTALSDSPEPCGRKLDFLLQEMNREVNTMGSKADGLRVSELVIAAKAELEKMREQVQNVE